MRVMMKYHVVLILTLLLVGCSATTSGVNMKQDYANVIKIAKEDLPEEQIRTLIPWKSESVQRIEKLPSYINSDELASDSRVYKVQLYTKKDDIVGPIGIFVDVTTQKVIGYQHRN